MSNGRIVNRKILECGVVALVNLRGDRISFYPRGKLPKYAVAYLAIGDNITVLRNYLVNVARGIVTD